MNAYFIKPGYNCNLTPGGERIEQYKTVPNNAAFQVACYKYSAALIRKNNWKSCIEFGSGSGYKLHKYIAPVAQRVVGIDLPHAVAYCRDRYPAIEWLYDDFDHPQAALDETFDLIISFDVIEHLIYPEALLNKIKRYASPATLILLSTPERDLFRGLDHRGPSPNRLHVREWNRSELATFVEAEGFTIKSHKILPAKSLNLKEQVKWALGRIKNNTCQLIECTYAG
jgi:2-polyprenyl-3-methyl-5-hydroxy-6-metoxy-1,4-benzoquinol methylase